MPAIVWSSLSVELTERTAVFDGSIMGASFASGDRLVAGRWHDSPFGPFADLMWARPDGRRILLAPTMAVRDFVAGHYSFDELVLTPVRVERTAGVIQIRAGSVEVDLSPQRRGIESWLLSLRPRALRTHPAWIAVEDRALRPIVRPLFASSDVRTRGVTATGAREWYAIHDFHRAEARGRIEGIDLGAAAPAPAASFGFSEFPDGPAVVRVTSIFRW